MTLQERLRQAAESHGHEIRALLHEAAEFIDEIHALQGRVERLEAVQELRGIQRRRDALFGEKKN